MPAYKDEKTGKWFAKFYYTNWQGIKKQKWKRGFATKKEALGFERDFMENWIAKKNMLQTGKISKEKFDSWKSDMLAYYKDSRLDNEAD